MISGACRADDTRTTGAKGRLPVRDELRITAASGQRPHLSRRLATHSWSGAGGWKSRLTPDPHVTGTLPTPFLFSHLERVA